MRSRYPDALGGADPLQVLQLNEATAAIGEARSVYAYVEAYVERLSLGSEAPRQAKVAKLRRQ